MLGALGSCLQETTTKLFFQKLFLIRVKAFALVVVFLPNLAPTRYKALPSKRIRESKHHWLLVVAVGEIQTKRLALVGA